MTTFNPLAFEFRSDPYSSYSRLRAEQPVAWASAAVPGFWGFWFVSRYADVVAGLKDPRFGREIEKALPPGTLPPLPEAHKPLMDMVADWMLFKDPPDHTRLRRLLNRAFDSAAVARMKPRVAEIARELLDQRGDVESFDIIADFAFPLPLLAISEMLGVPPADQMRFRELFRQIVLALDLTRTEKHIRKAGEVTRFFLDYFRRRVKEQRRAPKDNLLGALIDAHDGENKLTEDELAANCILLIYAGHEATTQMVGNGMLALLQHPAELTRLRAEPELISTALDEILRYESPQQIAFRYALKDAEIAGTAISKGQPVAFGLASANRDAAAFPEPDRFDVGRQLQRHIAFGAGVHTCVGLALAKIEGQVAIPILLERYREMEVVTFERQESVIVRGLRKLEVRCHRPRQ
jgi:cytochrome P450